MAQIYQNQGISAKLTKTRILALSSRFRLGTASQKSTL
jgi:hypothetical protein